MNSPSAWRNIAALLVSILADTVAAPLGEGLPVIFDLLVAGVIAALLGMRQGLMIALLIECVPGLGLFPTWIAAVLAMIARPAQATRQS